MAATHTSSFPKRVARSIEALALAATLGLPASVHAADEPPPFSVMRYDENYAYLADPARRVGFDDQLKYIRFGDAGYLSLGGEIRERFDSFDAPGFGIDTSSQHYLLQRLLVHADVHFNDRVRVFVQLGREDAFDKDKPYSVSDVDRLDLQNAFVDVVADANRHLTLRLGRQELAFNGVQRFVSVREGPNVRQSFDGLRATWAQDAIRFDAFATRPVLYKPGSFDDRGDSSQRFYGLYLTYQLAARQTLEAYAIELDREAVRFASTTGDERRHSFGARWAGKEGGFDHDAEVVYQTGSFASRDIRAWAVGLIGGYTFASPWSPRAGLELDAGSGDRHPEGGRLETFNPMFPKGAYFNESALTSWANLVMLRASVTVQPTASTSLAASVAERWRQTGNDAVYLQPYVPMPETLGNQERRVGEAYQFDAAWRANRYLTLSAQLLRQTAGPAIKLAGGRAANFGMFMAQFKF
jgi:hypothetical protein